MRTFFPALLLVVLPILGSSCGAPEPGPAQQLGPGPTWVFFSPKEVDPQALARAEAALSPEAQSRRARNRRDGSVVDARDLPVSEDSIVELEGLGFTVRTSSRWLNAVSVEGAGGDKDALRSLPGVRALRAVGRMEQRPGRAPWLPSSQTDARGGSEDSLVAELSALEVDLVHARGFLGAGVRVAVIDTGFSLEHPALVGAQSRLIEAWDFLGDDPVVANEGTEEDQALQDAHGTAVLGALTGQDGMGYLGVAPAVDLLLAKSESVQDEEPFEEDLWIAAVEWAEQRGAAIVTSSLGWSDWIDSADLDGETAVSSAFASSFAEATGMLMVQSIGNSGPDAGSLLAPSDSSGILAVGALHPSGEVADFSGRGPTVDGRHKPDLVAPGVDVAVPLSGESGYARLDGTSLAAPLVAGLAALALEAHPEWTLAEIRSALLASADQSSAPDSVSGWGQPSAWRVCGLACSCEDEDGDGAWAESCGGDDCNDEDPTVGLGFPELPYDGIDQDCDGLDLTDVDGDGFAGGIGGADCGDGNPAVFPSPVSEDGSVAPEGGHELCADDWDNDCDGLLNGADPDCAEAVGATTSGSSSSSSSSSLVGCTFSSSAGSRPGTSAEPLWSLLVLVSALLRRRRGGASWLGG